MHDDHYNGQEANPTGLSGRVMYLTLYNAWTTCLHLSLLLGVELHDMITFTTTTTTLPLMPSRVFNIYALAYEDGFHEVSNYIKN